MRRFRKEIRVNPLDTQQNVAIGISIPFNGTPVYTPTYTTKDQIKSNIINFFLTNKGERFMNVSFGGNLRAYLFEQTPELEQLHDFIVQNMEQRFPQTTVTDVEVNINDDNSVYIVIQYGINNSQDTISITIQP